MKARFINSSARSVARRVCHVLAGIAVVVAASSVAAMASPSPASASAIDSLHRHEWTIAAPVQCFDNGWDPYAPASLHIDLNWPDLVTSPTKLINGTWYSQPVYLMAELQYYDFSINVRNWRTAQGQPYSPWYYAFADNSGRRSLWYENTNPARFAPNRFSFPVNAGYVYRIKVWFYWGADGTWHSDTTDYCDFR